MAFSPISSWQIEGEKVEVVTDFLSWAFRSLWMVTVGMKSEDDCFLAGKLWQTYRHCVEKQRHYSADKGLYDKGYGLPSGHVQLWELDRIKGRVLKKTPESPLDSKEIKPGNLKGNQPWILFGRTGAEAETPVFGYLMCTADSLEKALGRNWGQN